MSYILSMKNLTSIVLKEKIFNQSFFQCSLKFSIFFLWKNWGWKGGGKSEFSRPSHFLLCLKKGSKTFYPHISLPRSSVSKLGTWHCQVSGTMIFSIPEMESIPFQRYHYACGHHYIHWQQILHFNYMLGKELFPFMESTSYQLHWI